MSHRTTNKHFQIFKKECKKWIDKFGLINWEVYYLHKKSKNLAFMTANLVGRVADIGLAKTWKNSEVSNFEIKKCAFHEVNELLLYRLRNLAEYRYTTYNEIDEEVHAIIRTLENVLFDK